MKNISKITQYKTLSIVVAQSLRRVHSLCPQGLQLTRLLSLSLLPVLFTILHIVNPSTH